MTNANSFLNLVQLRANPISEWRYYKGWEPSVTIQQPPLMLDNPVHDIWRKEAFRDYRFPLATQDIRSSFYDNPLHDISDEMYDRLTPALRLATIMIHVASPILVRILLCPYHTNLDGQRSFDTLWIPTQEDYKQLHHDLSELSRETRILYLPYAADAPVEPAVTGITGVLRDLDVVDHPQLPRNPRPIIMALAQNLFDQLRGDHWNRRPGEHKVRTMVMFTEVLVHELAHALWFRRRHTRETLPSSSVEPLVYPQSNSELGEALTGFIFGFEICLPFGRYRTRWDDAHGIDAPPDRPMWDGSAGVMAYDFHDSLNSDIWDLYTVSDESWYALFDQHTWAAVWAGRKLPFYMRPRVIKSTTAAASLGNLVQRIPGTAFYTSYNPDRIAPRYEYIQLPLDAHRHRPPVASPRSSEAAPSPTMRIFGQAQADPPTTPNVTNQADGPAHEGG